MVISRNAEMRTLEVQYQEFQTMAGRRKEWVVLGQRGTLAKSKKKKQAVKDARDRAKHLAKKLNQSVEVKIYRKDGSWQEENVYKP